MSVKIHLSPKEILQKQFDTKMRGYNRHQVDSFLDLVIKDYRTLMSTSHRLNDENENLRAQVNQLRQEKSSRPVVMSRTSAPTSRVATGSANEQYVNMLRRINKLERFISSHNLR